MEFLTESEKCIGPLAHTTQTQFLQSVQAFLRKGCILLFYLHHLQPSHHIKLVHFFLI